jgi:hypothetical protein
VTPESLSKVLAKSMPGGQHYDVLDSLKEAEFAALQGEALAHAVSEWVRMTKRQLTKSNQNRLLT